MQDKRLQQALNWLNRETEKDSKEIQSHKNQMIEEIKKLDKTKMFVPPKKEKLSFFKKLSIIFGYGKKR